MPPAKIPGALRRLVHGRAQSRCEYCQTSEWLSGLPCEIDHIIPRAKGGPTTALRANDNLCLACASCNGYKRASTHAADPESGEEAALFNPRQQRWQEHFAWSEDGTAIIGLILFSVVALGIVNTLFMSLYERMFKFGVMRAVGTRPFAVGRLIVFEAGALALVSIVLGSILGFVVTVIFMRIGIDYTGIEYAGVTFRDLLYPQLETYQFTVFPLCVFLFTMLVGLYPARYAARMGAAEAMRKSL